MEADIIKKVSNYSDFYVKENMSNYDKSLLLNNWFEALDFFLDRVYYQGRSDALSSKVKDVVSIVLEEYAEKCNDKCQILNKSNFSDIEDELKGKIGKGKIGRGRDIDMTIDILSFVSEIEDKNIIRYSLSKIKSGDLKNHYYELQKIRSIGPKISSLYFRDLFCLYSENKLSPEEMVLLQPIDTWVRQVALKIGMIEEKDEGDIVREKIFESCERAGVSVIRFNQGAWYLGANSFNVLMDRLKDENEFYLL